MEESSLMTDFFTGLAFGIVFGLCVVFIFAITFDGE